MRRTATLSIFAEEKENNLANIDNLFAINKKCILQLGIVNKVPNYIYKTIDEKTEKAELHTINYQNQYGNIIWFPLGVYVMFNPAVAHAITGVTISMNLKDKMCLLNGDLGGEIHSAVDFGSQDQLIDADSVTLQNNSTLIYNIIKQLVNHWGNEKLDNIIISEVPLQIKKTVKWIGEDDVYLITTGNPKLTTVEPEQGQYEIKSPGQDIGFIYDNFCYPGELSCNAGDTVTSILDKIIGIMGNYQYFYDVFGNFVFREKQNYLNMTNVAYWTKESNLQQKTLELPMDSYKTEVRLTKPIYSFIENEYTSAYNNTLNFNNIKNDFVVWGSRQTMNSNYRIPCRYHLAIDKKPSVGHKHSIALYEDSVHVIRAVAYAENKPAEGTFLFPQAILQDAKGKIFKIIENRSSVDWREQLYYQMLEDQKKGTGTNTEINNSYFQYYAELKEQFPKIFDLKEQKYKDTIIKDPEEIDYFLDFIDESSQLGQYSVNNIGRRAKIIDANNEGINCVFEPEIPDIVYIDTTRYTQEELESQITHFRNIGQRYIQIPSEYYSLLSIGGVLNSCYEMIKDLLYQYTHVNNTISISTLPIYYFEPNTRITIEDSPSGIYGDYIIQSISLPLDISSMMTINAYKALQKI